MSLWTIFKSPLMFGGHLPENDAFTDSLLTNREILYMHSHSVDNKQLSKNENKIIWSATDPANGDKFAALFNLGDDGFVNTKSALYRSGTISYLTTDYSTEVNVDIPQGSKQLCLVVTDGGDGTSYDHADWINPVLVMADGTEQSLTDYDYLKASVGWGSLGVNKNIEGGKLSEIGRAHV